MARVAMSRHTGGSEGARSMPRPPRGAAGAPPLARPPSRSGAPLPASEARQIVLSGASIPYVLRASARARRVSLRISPAAGLEVVVPRGVGAARAEAVLREKADW